MSQANLYASLTGLLAVEAQRRGTTQAAARGLWYSVAGEAPPTESKNPVPLAQLDVSAIEHLRQLVAEQYSPSVAKLLPPDVVAKNAPAGRPAVYESLLTDLTQKINVLNDKPEETADSTLRALWQVAAGYPMSVEQAAESELPVLADDALARLRELIAQRLAGIPLAHLTGRQRFMGLELMAGREALVPRKETELLGSAARAVLQQLAATQEGLCVIDVCTGAGNLALSLASAEPRARVYVSDLSSEAVELARRNAKMLVLDARVEFRQGDFLTPFADGQFERNVDLMVCNPPYISSGKVGTMPREIIGHEPSLAFDGGPFGVKILQRLLSEAPRHVRPGGWLAFEVGLGQGPALIDRVRKNPAFGDPAAVVDAAGAIRAIVVPVN
jgi:release factor glutamine methyltransferase